MPDLNDELMRELLSTFRYEAAEHIEEMNKALLQFERTSVPEERQEQIQQAFRAAHSLKGAARAVSLNEIQTIAHAMETVFQRVRDKEAVLDPEQCDTLYDALDVIQQLLEGGQVDSSPLLNRLQAISGSPSNGAVTTETVAGDAPQEAHLNGDMNSEDAHRETTTTTDETIRVSLRKLDDLMAEVGELLVSRISVAQRMTETRQISQNLTQWSKTWAELKLLLKRHGDPRLTEVIFAHADTMHSLIEAFGELEQSTYRDVMRLDMVTNNLQDKVRQVRMIPFQVQVLSLERVVRDAARAQDKNVDFVVNGSQTELDKKVLELLKDPLLHLLRNAVGHGIETPSEREALGKAAVGQIKIDVQQRGSEVHITVSDDGRGFDLEHLREAYTKRYGDEFVPENIVNVAFMAGVTTSKEVNEISGRGIGLDVVREQLDELHGRVHVNSTPGAGSAITMIVPTSLAITRTLLVEATGRQYAIPLLSIEKIVVPDDIITLSGKPILRTDSRNIPLASLSTILEHPDQNDPKKQLALILSTGEQSLAVLVDDVITEQELAVKTLGFPVVKVRNVIGAALLGNGQPVVVLNPAELIHSYNNRGTVSGFITSEEKPEEPQVRVLVVDDSITTRTLERNILEAAGFIVYTATDGLEALNQLRSHEVDVVVSDIEMPNMNGFELTTSLRNDASFVDLPVILVTSLESESDRERGMRSGANAYIVKRGFDQAELLATIENFV